MPYKILKGYVLYSCLDFGCKMRVLLYLYQLGLCVVIWIILIGKWRMNIFVCSSNREEGGFSFSCNHFVLCFCLC